MSDEPIGPLHVPTDASTTDDPAFRMLGGTAAGGGDPGRGAEGAVDRDGDDPDSARGEGGAALFDDPPAATGRLVWPAAAAAEPVSAGVVGDPAAPEDTAPVGSCVEGSGASSVAAATPCGAAADGAPTRPLS